MKVLVVSPLLYHERCGNGGGVVCFRFLAGLAARHEIAFVGFNEGSDSIEHEISRKALNCLCSRVEVVPRPVPNGFERLVWRALQWMGGAPAESRIYLSDRMHAALHRVRAEFSPDIAILQFPYMAQYVSDMTGVPVVMDVEDVFFVSRLREYTAQSYWWPRMKRLVSWLAWTRYERHWYSRCDILMAVSDQDRAALHALVPEMPSFTSVPAIAARLLPHRAMTSGGPRVAFAGNFGHPPNLDGLRWLSAEIAPRLDRLCPGVRIVVAGRGIPHVLTSSLHSSIEVLGFVDDYDQFVRSCTLFIAPLRFGGGVKIKVLEALACGRPVVSTSVGAEGIPLGPAEGLQVADTAAGFAAIVAAQLAAPELWAGAAARGAVAVATQFGVEAKVRGFEEATSRLLRIGTKPALVDGLALLTL